MSDAFEKWYETYDSDGGSLMLFNSIDLEAAWNAAMLHAVKVVRYTLINSRRGVEVAAAHECIANLLEEVQDGGDNYYHDSCRNI